MQSRNNGKIYRDVLAVCVAVFSGLSIAHCQVKANTVPLVLKQTEDATFAPNVVSVHSKAQRVYIGRRYNTSPERLNLEVYTLNKGEIVGEPRCYRDSALPLPAKGRSNVMAIEPVARLKKLYVAYAVDGAGAGDESRLISVYDTDDQGEPVGTSRSYASGNPNKSVGDMAVHPSKSILYTVGWGGAAVYTYQLNTQGEPEGEPRAFPVGGQGKYEVAVSSDGKRLYLGTYPDVLEVVQLDTEGFPTGKPQSYKAGTEQAYLRFEYSPRA